MLAIPHPEVLAPDWVPPTLIARSEPLERLGRALPVPLDPPERTAVAVVRGPPGSGTSAVARRAGLDVAERLRREVAPGLPLFAAVRVRSIGGPLGVASELLRTLDPQFNPRGFTVAQLMAGFLRRILHGARPAVVVLDDIGTECADLRPIVGALLAPDRFLPEGTTVRPSIWLVVAGHDVAEAGWRRVRSAGVPFDRAVSLPPYTLGQIEAIVRDRARRALGRDAPDGWAERIVRYATLQGTGARRVIELLRCEALGAGGFEYGLPIAPSAKPVRLAIEPRLLEALERASLHGPTLFREVRAWEARLAHQQGVRPLPSTTLWRRIVRLEAAGVIRREVRPGGSGGTQSRVELVRAVPRDSLPTGPSGTLPRNASAFGVWGP
jgi:hypothetical protein